MRFRCTDDDAAYVERLTRLQGRWWKRLLDVQRPYRRYLTRLDLGLFLDVGCGIGRNLTNAGGKGIGVDINPFAVEACRNAGLQAYVPEEFVKSKWAQPGAFDSLVAAHVVEHMRYDEACAMLASYVPLVKSGGRVVLIAPQERGFASDCTHVELFDFAALEALMKRFSVRVTLRESFPLPRWCGHLFAHNEFVVVGTTAMPK